MKGFRSSLKSRPSGPFVTEAATFAYPDMNIRRMPGARRVTSWASTRPSNPGMITSVRSRSGGAVRVSSISSAVMPESVEKTVYPADPRIVFTKRRTDSSSSTRRILSVPPGGFAVPSSIPSRSAASWEAWGR